MKTKITKSDFNINDILINYLACAIWTEEDFDKELLYDKTYNDFTKESKDIALSDINKFLNIAIVKAEDELINFINLEPELGHNIWLSRNGHGAGFFDDYNDKLQSIARDELKSCNGLIVNLENQIEFEKY